MRKGVGTDPSGKKTGRQVWRMSSADQLAGASSAAEGERDAEQLKTNGSTGRVRRDGSERTAAETLASGGEGRSARAGG